MPMSLLLLEFLTPVHFLLVSLPQLASQLWLAFLLLLAPLVMPKPLLVLDGIPDAAVQFLLASLMYLASLLWLGSLPLLASLVMPTSLLLLVSFDNFTIKNKIIYRNIFIGLTICLLQALEVSHFWNMGVCDTKINRQPIWRQNRL
jgi:hypothetical protein